MEWFTAIGALASPVANIVDSFTGTGKAKAEAAEAAANAQTAAFNAQAEQTRIQAESMRQTMLYSLVGVGVIVAGFIAYRAVA